MIIKNKYFLNLFFLFFSVTALIIVYYLEFFQNIQPCKLCIYQRIPYFIIILLAISYLLLKNQSLKKITFIFYILIFFFSLIMAIHHLGVEKNLWNSVTSCDAEIKNFTNNKDLKEFLLNKDFISCNQVTFQFLGLSLAGYNVIISLILLGLSIIGFRKN